MGLVCLFLDGLPLVLLLPLAVAAGGLFGAVYLLVNVLIDPGQMSPQSRTFAEHVRLPAMHEVLGWLGIAFPRTPLNMAFPWALVCGVLVWIFIWHTRWGYELRTVGANSTAAVYAGISPSRNTVRAMAISGALAGMLGLNEVMGVNHRLLLNFTAGYGFVGIAVSLMGRNHPLGIVVASLLFGALYQGGTELAFEMPKVSRELVVVIQGLVILFVGALEYLFRPVLLPWLRRRRRLAAE